MTDQELLELAAKAAVIDLVWDDLLMPGYYSDWRGLPQWEYWNPLNDDGDALRLANKLRINIQRETWLEDKSYPPSVDCGPNNVNCWHELPEGDDADAATRRAIVTAAAMIGKEMP